MSQLQVDTILNTNGDGAPDFPHGMTVTGIVTATTLNQNVTGIITAQSLSIGDNIQFGNAGVVTATAFAGDGANLTNLPPAGGVIVGVSSGSITFAIVASIAALPVPLIGRVKRLLVCQAYLNNSCTSLIKST